MKQSNILTFAIVLLLFSFGRCIEISSQGEVTNWFTCLRNIFRKGVPLMFGPSDPFELESYTRALEPLETGHWLYGLYQFKNIKFTGLSKFSVRSVSASHLDIEKIFCFNTKMAFNLRLTGSYNVTDGFFMDIAKVKGHGNISLRTSPVEVDLTLNFKENCTKLRDGFKNAHMGIHIKSIVNITGLEPNERMSSLVSRQLATIIDDLFNRNTEMVDSILDPMLNDFIKSLMLSKLPPIFRPIVELYYYFVWKSCNRQYFALEDLLKKIWNL